MLNFQNQYFAEIQINMKFFAILGLFIIGAYAHCDKAPFIKASWDQVKHNEVDILYSIFKEYPEIQARFPRFVGKDLEELKGTAIFALHATRIMSFMSEVINLVGNPVTMPAIETLITEMANNHKNRGVTRELFDKFHFGFMKYLKAHTNFDEQTQNAWKVVSDEHHAIIYAILEGKSS